MDRETRLKRLHFRAHHRGTREADLMVGGFFDAHHAGWDEEQLAWFEALIEEQDVDIMAWAIGAQPVPDRWAGAMMEQMCTVDYVRVAK